MSELPPNSIESGSFEANFTQYVRDLDTIFTSEWSTKIDGDLKAQLRKDSVANLANGLNSTEINDDLADLMIDYLSENKDSSEDNMAIRSVYAYDAVIEQAQRGEKFKVPTRFLDFVIEQAKSQQEETIAEKITNLRNKTRKSMTDMILEKTVQTEYIHDDETNASDEEQLDRSLDEVAYDLLGDLYDKSDNALQDFKDFIEDSKAQFDNSLSPNHSDDYSILTNKSTSHEDIYEILINNQLSTSEGLDLAPRLHDMLIIKQDIDVDDLFEYIRSGRMLTIDGQDAIALIHDRKRLDEFSEEPEHLLDSLKQGQFFTSYGREAALYMHDSLRLNKFKDDQLSLHRDIYSLNCYLTKEGRQEAVARLKELEA